MAGDHGVDRAVIVAMRSMRRSPKTRSQVEKLLRDGGFRGDVVGEALRRLESALLVDDRLFAKLWVESRRTRHGLGARRLERELLDRGVSAADVGAALAAVNGDSEADAARAAARRLGRRLQGLDREIAARRMMGMLLRRGYASEIARVAVNDWLEDREAG